MTLRYEKDSSGKMKLVMAETRGDGLVGEDVTANAFLSSLTASTFWKVEARLSREDCVIGYFLFLL